MNNFDAGDVLFGVAILALMMMLIFIGSLLKRDNIIGHCALHDSFTASGQVYDCTLREAE